MPAADTPLLTLAFAASIIEWRGPAPFFYAPVPPAEAEAVRGVAKRVSYGWGVIPVEARLNGGPAFTTSLFPRDGTYLVPLKDSVRRATAVTAGDTVSLMLILRAPRR